MTGKVQQFHCNKINRRMRKYEELNGEYIDAPKFVFTYRGMGSGYNSS